MHSTARAALALTTVLLLTACTESPAPEAQDAPSPAGSAAASPSESPGDGSSGLPGGVSLDEVQQMLDSAVDELYSSPSVDVRWELRGSVAHEPAMRSTINAEWQPRNHAWVGVRHDHIPELRHGPGVTDVMWVDDHAYVRWPAGEDDPIGWYRGNASLIRDHTKNGWPFTAELDAIVATSATQSGDVTTIVGQVPNQVALRILGPTYEIEGSDYDNELYPESALVSLTVEDGYPTRLEVYGKNVGMPAQGVSLEMMQQIAAIDTTYRYSKGNRLFTFGGVVGV